MSVVYKTVLVRDIAKRTHMSQAVVSGVLASLATELAASLQRGDTVQVTNLGHVLPPPSPSRPRARFPDGRATGRASGHGRRVRAGAF